MKYLEKIRQEAKVTKDKINDTEERLRQLKNQEKKILKQDIIKRRKDRTRKNQLKILKKKLNEENRKIRNKRLIEKGANRSFLYRLQTFD